MENFIGKVAVITGAASGIGLGIADRCAREGMKIVLADIEKNVLKQVEKKFKTSGADVIAVATDVSKFSDIQALARKTLDTFGGVHLLFNNAGVSSHGTNVYESCNADWEWFIGVNLMSVVYGVQEFVPLMLKQETDCHIINTASTLGLTTAPGMGPYNVTKHGIVSLSETLYQELAEQKSKIKVSVLCPGFVNTRILESNRNRPREVQNNKAGGQMTAENNEIDQSMRESVETGISPAQVADCVFNALRDEKFYILTHPEYKEKVRTRMTNILQDRNPV
jgi:NAD(P)-dependent dehydrogenase (short-subunit alcohol dehydrogenase family)